MTDRSATHGLTSRDQWAAQIAAMHAPQRAPRPTRTPITTDRILDTAFDLVATEGFDALTMRRIAAALQTGPASLYTHVRNKAALDNLMIGQLCARVTLPPPDPAHWRHQIIDICRQLRDQYLRYPGISRAALATTPTSLDTLRVAEGMLAILLAARVPPQTAAWTIDATLLYVAAYSFEASLRHRPAEDPDERTLDRAELVERLRMLPTDRFPHTVAHASELTAGDGHDRFDFTLEQLLRGVTPTTSDNAPHSPTP